MPNIKKVIQDAIAESQGPADFGFGDAVSLGESRLDDLTGALNPGQIALLWCEVPQLASAWALHVLYQNAVQAGITATYISNHVPLGEVTGRLIAAASNVSLASLRLGFLDEQSTDDVARVSGNIARSQINLESVGSSEQLVAVLEESNDAFACIDGRITPDLQPHNFLEAAKNALNPSVAGLVCLSGGGLEPDFELHHFAEVVIRLRMVEGGPDTACPPFKSTLLKSPLGRLADVTARWCPESSAIRSGGW